MRGFGPNDKVALLISECQKGVLDKDLAMFKGLVDQAEKRQILPKIAKLADAFRQVDMPVIHVHVVHKKGYVDLPKTSLIMAQSAKTGGMQEGSIDVESVPEVAPKDGDIVHARSFSLVAFNGTDLNAMLRNMGVTTLVLVGVSSNVALPGMAVCAADLGFQVAIPEDCIAGATVETHEFSVKNTLPLFANVTSSEQVIEALSGL